MKKYLLLALTAVFMFSIQIFAQNQINNKGSNTRGKMHEHNDRHKFMSPQNRAERMAKVLNLTTEETQKVQVLFEKEESKRREMNTSREQIQQGNNKGDLREQMERERSEYDAQLEQIIGKDKMKHWKETINNLRKDIYKKEDRNIQSNEKIIKDTTLFQISDTKTLKTKNEKKAKKEKKIKKTEM